MWVDHLTLAVHHIEAFDEVVRDLGLLRRAAPPLFGGTERAVVPLSQGFLELVAVSDRPRARQYTLGRALLRFLAAGEGIFRVVAGVPDLDRFIRERAALGVHYWPPIDEQITGIGPTPIPIRLTQMEPMLPWIMAYQKPQHRDTESSVRLAVVDVQSLNPVMTAVQFRMALGPPLNTPPPGGTAVMDLDNVTFRFCRGAYTGFSSLLLEGEAASAAIEMRDGTLSATVLRA